MGRALQRGPGTENITAEVLRTDIRFATDWSYDPFHKIWNAETMPEDWCRGLIVKLSKKGDRCSRLSQVRERNIRVT